MSSFCFDAIIGATACAEDVAHEAVHRETGDAGARRSGFSMSGLGARLEHVVEAGFAPACVFLYLAQIIH
jgi:hypothetical protein